MANTRQSDEFNKNFNKLKTMLGNGEIELREALASTNTYAFTQEEIYALCETAVKQSGLAVQFVPLALQSKPLLMSAVTQNALALRYIPENARDSDICYMAFKKDYNALQYIPEKLITTEFFARAIIRNIASVTLLPPNLRTEEMYLIAVKTNGESLKYIPEENRSQLLCLEAVKQTAQAFMFVPKPKINGDVYAHLINHNGLYLNKVPIALRDKTLCVLAVKSNGLALRDVPDKVSYPLNFFVDAVTSNALALIFVPDAFKSEVIEKITPARILAENISLFGYFPLALQESNAKLYRTMLNEVKHIAVLNDVSSDTQGNDIADHELIDIRSSYAHHPKRRSQTLCTQTTGLSHVISAAEKNAASNINLVLIGHATPVSQAIAGIDSVQLITLLRNHPSITQVTLMGCTTAKADISEQEWEMIERLQAHEQVKSKQQYGFVSMNGDIATEGYDIILNAVGLHNVAIMTHNDGVYKIIHVMKTNDKEFPLKVVEYPLSPVQAQQVANQVSKRGLSALFPKSSKPGQVNMIRFSDNPMPAQQWSYIETICTNKQMYDNTHPNYQTNKKIYPFLTHVQMNEVEVDQKLHNSLLKTFYTAIREAQQSGLISRDIKLKAYPNGLHVDTRLRQIIVTRTHPYHSLYVNSAFFSGAENIDAKKVTGEFQKLTVMLQGLDVNKKNNSTVNTQAKAITVTVKYKQK